ncbi:uncharacterized protein EURHEDRAFT_413245 [Aspergillus ruber CBS 135680]|uniref:Retrovirus-related Pol polyprotein from transposon TNT 1-94-like beta-barrel domain-containing protein n=1 Tax=Aspergillus ruber (strain CBS 135680) TaxID=1388766 RepID=A0A017SCB7_ASPRC|nr:uncharacterized protein EURHEDRAFT_413245 [Aspergillus ruber CBS 135680]EYE94436.1 hypothetical protein EURHEDRAFT_413245 [Aspergillus ruber CBS 135680]
MGEIGEYWRDYKGYKRHQEDLRLKQQALKEQESTLQDETTSTNPAPNLAANNNYQDHSNKTQKTKNATNDATKDFTEDTKKKTSTPNTRRCWDWMMVSGSTHYARNRSSFSTYRHVRGQITSSILPGTGRIQVLGIGAVKLNMIRGPDDPRPYTLVLKDVLHIPSAVCNGISIFLLPVIFDVRNRRVFDSHTKEPLFYGEKYFGLDRAVLAGDTQGETYMEDGTGYMLSINAMEKELETLARKAKH